MTAELSRSWDTNCSLQLQLVLHISAGGVWLLPEDRRLHAVGVWWGPCPPTAETTSQLACSALLRLMGVSERLPLECCP